MAKRKRKKRVQLWAAKDLGSTTVYLYDSKPTLEYDTCDSCGQKRPNFVSPNGYVADYCEPDFSKLTGLNIAEGEAVRLKVTLVQE